MLYTFISQQTASNAALNTIASIAPNLIAGSGLDPSGILSYFFIPTLVIIT